MPTDEEMTAALTAALAGIGKTDPEEARSFLAMWKAMRTLDPIPGPVDPQGPSAEAVLALTLVPKTDEQRQRLQKIQADTEALWNDIKQAGAG